MVRYNTGCWSSSSSTRSADARSNAASSAGEIEQPAMVGVMLGLSDGVELGMRVGPSDGFKLGMRVGPSDGFKLGLALGFIVVGFVEIANTELGLDDE